MGNGFWRNKPTQGPLFPPGTGRAADVRILADNALHAALTDLCGIGQALYATTDARQYRTTW